MSITFRQTTDSRGTNKGSALSGSEYDNNLIDILNASKPINRVFVENYGFSSLNSATQNTNAVNEAIQSISDGGELAFPQSGTYSINSCNQINKSIKIILNKCLLNATLDPLNDTDNAKPLFHFRPLSITEYDINDATEGSDEITLSNAGDGDNFSLGDFIYIKSNEFMPYWDTSIYLSGEGTKAYKEVNEVKSVSSDTLAINYSLGWDYNTATISPTVSLVNPIYRPSVIGGTIIESNVDGRYAGSVEDITAPHVIKFDFCKEPLVVDTEFRNINLDCTRFVSCLGGGALRTTARDAQRSGEGGHGNNCKFFDGCRSLLFREVRGYNIRHTVDYTNGIECNSTLCVSSNNLGSYSWHGLGTKRCWSINDTNNSGLGWDIGRSKFATDYDIQVINPQGTTDRRQIEVYGNSQNVSIINPIIKSFADSRSIAIYEKCKNIDIISGYLDSENSSSEAIYIDDQLLTGSTGFYPENIKIKNVEIKGGSAIAINVTGNKGYLDIDATVNSTQEFSCVRIQDNGSNRTYINVTGIFTGTRTRCIRMNVSNNLPENITIKNVKSDSSYTSTEDIDVEIVNNSYIYNNNVGDINYNTATTSLPTAIANGSLFFNNNNVNDTFKNVINAISQPSSVATTISDLKTDFNTLLTNLKTQGILE